MLVPKQSGAAIEKVIKEDISELEGRLLTGTERCLDRVEGRIERLILYPVELYPPNLLCLTLSPRSEKTGHCGG